MSIQQRLLLFADLAVLSIPVTLAATLAFWCSNRDGGKLRFSLSGLMVVIALIAASCAWWAHHARHCRQEQKTLAQWNESVRSYPVYDGPQWLRRLLPNDAPKPFHHLALVYITISPTNLGGTAKLPDEFVAAIPQLPHLRALSVENPYYIQAEDPAAQLRLAPGEIEQLDGLERLEFFYRAADDETVRQIVQLPQLRALKVTESSLTDDGLKMLCASRTLELISLCGCPEVTDAGIDALFSIPSLRRLEIQQCGKLTLQAFHRTPELPHLTLLCYTISLRLKRLILISA